MIYDWKKIVKHGLPLLTLFVFIEIFAGQILQGEQDTLVKLPIFLISIPVINGVGGNLGSVLGARIASGLHVGYIDIDLKDKTMRVNLLTSILIGIVLYFVLAILIYLVVLFSSTQVGIVPMKFISIVLGTGILLVCVISLASIITAFWSFKKGLDPDDTVAPVVTTIGDTLGIIFLFAFIGVVGI